MNSRNVTKHRNKGVWYEEEIGRGCDFYLQSPQIVKSITGFNWISPHI
jgi:hypothetical protein